MSLGKTWGPRLARAVSPGEADLAEMYIDAFIEGGGARRDLFAGPVNESGGFTSGETLSIIAPVLAAVAAAAPLLNALLASPQISTLSSMANSASNVLRLFGYGKGESPVGSTSGSIEPVDIGNPKMSVGSEPDSGHPEVLRRVIDCVRTELQRQGMSDEQSSVVTLSVVEELLRKPDESIQLVNALETSKDRK